MPDPVNLAYSHLQAGRLEQARATLQRFLARTPADPAACAAMSLVLLNSGDPRGAAYYAGIAAEKLPDDPRPQHNYGNILVAAGRFEEALEPLHRARERLPTEPQVALALANALSGLNRFASAADVLRDTLGAHPNHPRLLNNLGHALHQMGRIEEGLPLVRRACELEPASITTADGLAAMVAYAPGVSGLEQRQACERYAKLAHGVYAPLPPLPPGPPARDRSADPRLRIGFLSPDLRAHAVTHFAEPIFDHLDRGRFFVAAYNAAAAEDAVSARLRGKTDLWRHVGGKPHDQLARLIRSDRIDILVDLAGHTLGGRLPVMAMRPARVQVTALGFPLTTGLTTVDFRLTDALADPEGYEPFATERLLRVEGCSQCYRPPEAPPPVGVRDGSEPVTFVAFSSLLKFNGRLAALWARVLAATPGSRLLLRHLGLKEEAVRADVAQRIAAEGVDPSRVMVEPPVELAGGGGGGGGGSHLLRYQAADIALDTTPYTGTTTVCEALLMGVPMVSLLGDTPPARVAGSILTAAGLGELCAANEDEYVRIAAGLATDRGRLAALRAGLRERFLASPVCDAAGYSSRLGTALERAAAGGA